jgi:hypothetical protein
MITYFSLPSVVSCYNTDIVQNPDNQKLIKNAIILVEGDWTDNKQRKHVFSKQRLLEIANNTNHLIEQGVRIPILQDHQKTQNSVIGDLEGYVEVRELTSSDLPEGKFKNLLGKLAVFTRNVAIKSKSAIEQFTSGLLETISPGVDINNNVIKEISVTPTPAIPGMRIFSRGNGYISQFNTKKSYTWENLEEENQELDETFLKVDESYAKLKVLLTNILTLDKEEAEYVGNEQELAQNALMGFVEQVYDMLDLDNISEEDNENTANMSAYNTSVPIFSLSDMINYKYTNEWR